MKRKRESFVHRTRNLLSIRELLDFPIPHCSKCHVQMVRLGVKWVCKEHTLVDQVTMVNEYASTIDNGIQLVTRPHVEKVPVGVVYPNRWYRRRAS